MAKYLYNTTASGKTYVANEVPAEGYLLVPYNLETKFANSSILLTDIAAGTIIVSKTDSQVGHLVDINAAINFLKDNLPQQVESLNQPFGAKTLSDGSRLFRRVRGISGQVQNQPDNIDFVIPFAKCKITGLQIINGKLGDKATFQVLDTAQGTISGIPNAVLNTFGQDVYIVPDIASYPSKYDADLIGGMVLRLAYDAVDGELLPRTVYVNLDLHEVVAP